MSWTDKYTCGQKVWVAHYQASLSTIEPMEDFDCSFPIVAWIAAEVKGFNYDRTHLQLLIENFGYWWVGNPKWIKDSDPNLPLKSETESRCCDCGEPTIYPQIKNVANGFACYSCRITNNWKYANSI